MATLVSLLVAIPRWAAGTGTVSPAPRFCLVAVLVGAGGFGLSFLLFNLVIVQVDAGRTAVILNLIPVFGIASAVIFLGAGMTGRDALGAVLIGSSVVYFTIADHREATAQGPMGRTDGTGHPRRTGCGAPEDDHGPGAGRARRPLLTTTGRAQRTGLRTRPRYAATIARQTA